MHFEVDFSNLIKAIPNLKIELADVTLEHVKSKIHKGMPPPLKRPRKDKSTHTPLYHTGNHLHDTMKSNITKDGFTVGTNFIGAALLHNGGRGVPPRRYLSVDDELIVEIIDTIKEELGAT